MIKRNITYKENSLIVPLYKAIVRAHLEYCIQAWSPYPRKELDKFEKYRGGQLNSFQAREILDEERLNECGLTTLETRRLRGGQTVVFY